ncbi:MAG: ATP-binding protein [Rhodospirillaceae bacterium]|nr:ATP-binding protein [Rhodospirillaceae bacterium]
MAKADLSENVETQLGRIADALDRIAPDPRPKIAINSSDAFVWDPGTGGLKPVPKVNRVPFGLLKGIESQAKALLSNTQNHLDGLPANNALLWGARGTGKSSLVKAVHALVNSTLSIDARLVLVEIHREDITTLPRLLDILRNQSGRCIVFCDDLTFEGMDDGYKALKAVLEGGLEGRPENLVFYATSNRRHMMARDMIENEQATPINRGEALEEKVSLSDRFGLWLGFHHLDQDTYFAIVEGYAASIGISLENDALRAEANEWAVTRGSRSGRVAWQFIQHIAGEQGIKINLPD